MHISHAPVKTNGFQTEMKSFKSVSAKISKDSGNIFSFFPLTFPAQFHEIKRKYTVKSLFTVKNNRERADLIEQCYWAGWVLGLCSLSMSTSSKNEWAPLICSYARHAILVLK